MALSGLVPDAPTPPNPMQTAAAQTGTNVSTAIANSYLGNVNQNTPQGNLSFDVSDTFSFTDPTTGQSFNIPRWTANQTLTPQGYNAFNAQQGAQVNLANMAQQQTGALGEMLAAPFDPRFNVQDYLQRRPDVMAAAQQWGADPYQFAQQHWQEYGRSEMPSWSSIPEMGDVSSFDFNAQQYLQENPDVARAAAMSGEDPSAFAMRHFREFGANEGRNLSNYNALTSFGDTPDALSDYGSGGVVLGDIAPSWDITRSYGPQDNFSADRARVEAGMFERLNPQLQLENDRMRQQLADQGIRLGSDAYTKANDVYARMANDARLGVIERGGAEQQRMNQMARDQAAFENAAQAQGFSQAQARAMFFNQAQQQREAQAAARGAFYNQAAAQNFAQRQGRAQFFNQGQQQNFNLANTIFNARNQQRNQYLQEQYQRRAQPINEISALLSGSQVQQPNFINAPRNQIPTTDVAGLINQGFAQQNDIYKSGLNFWGDVIGGSLGAAGSIGSAAYKYSDREAKENIHRMGTVFSDKGDLPIYRYSYKDDPEERRHTGPMAQDVEKLDPASVVEIGGRKHIDMHRMGSVFGMRRAA